MKRMFVLALLVLATVSLAEGERQILQFRLKKDPQAPMRGWLLEYDQSGFRIQKLGNGPKVFVHWTELVEEDTRALRLKLKLDLSEDERLGLIDGHEIFFKGGLSERGLLVEHDKERKRYLVRMDGIVLPYPDDRIERVVEIKIKESEVYTEDEVYIRRLQRTPPSTAADHRILADYMYDIGNWEKSEEHYQQAIQLAPQLRGELEGRLAEAKDYIEDEAAGRFFRKAKSLANLHGRFDLAIQMIEEHMGQFPGSKRRGLKVMDQIKERRQQKMEVLYHRTKSRALDKLITRYLRRQQPDIQTAMSWATSALKDEIEVFIRHRMNMSAEEFERFTETRAKGSPHFATYWSGSFVISSRAKKGKSSAKAARGDPDTWWSSYADTKSRSTWLKAYVAERLDLFEIVQIRSTPCSRCGGTGRVKKMSFKGLKALSGGHEWMEICPRCFGARSDRGVAYR